MAGRKTGTKKQVVFIMGAGHSGSTLLELLLGSHSGAFALGELWSLSRKFGSDEKGYRICGICGDDCEFWNGRVSLPIIRSYFRWGRGDGLAFRLRRQFGSLRRDIYAHLSEWTGARTLVDSSKELWWIKRQLRPFWFWKETTPFLIHMCRDGRAVVNSYLRKYPDRDLASLARRWARETLERERYYQALPEDRRVRVSYEELATKPVEVMTSVCRVLGIPFEPKMLCYWQHEHHIVEGNLGTRLLIYRYREQFGDRLMEHWMEANRAVYQTDPAFYQQMGLAIGLDLRWQEELDQDQLELFDSIAGKVNEVYAYDATEDVS